jgi:hypothetical protein
VLRKVALEDSGPLAAGAEEDFDDLANCTVTSSGTRNVRRNLLDFGNRVGYGDRKTNPAKYRQIGEIIAGKGDFLPPDATPLQHLPKGSGFPGPGNLKQLCHPQFGRPQRGGFGVSPADPHHWEPDGLEQDQAEPILNIEPLQLHSIARNRTDVHPVIGQYAIHIQSQQANPSRGSSTEKAHTLALPQISSVWPINSASWWSGH